MKNAFVVQWYREDGQLKQYTYATKQEAIDNAVKFLSEDVEHVEVLKYIFIGCNEFPDHPFSVLYKED